jgi:hypothetical protein
LCDSAGLRTPENRISAYAATVSLRNVQRILQGTFGCLTGNYLKTTGTIRHHPFLAQANSDNRGGAADTKPKAKRWHKARRSAPMRPWRCYQVSLPANRNRVMVTERGRERISGQILVR